MVDERQRVIAELLAELHKLGLTGDAPFSVDFIPGEPPRFHLESASPSSSLSAVTGVTNAQKVHPK